MKQLYCCVVISLLILLATSEPVIINNNETLKSYLCNENETISSMTYLSINASHMLFQSNEENYCHVQNTSNIKIIASGSVGHVTVECLGYTGFKFWNVSNLTIKGIVFVDCENWIYNSVSESKVLTSLLFDHCVDLTLDNVLAYSSDDTAIDILGVNLCGFSKINVNSALHPARLSAVIYFQDSRFINASKCANSNIMVSSSKFRSKSIEDNQNLSTCLNQVDIEEYALSICLLQQSFRVLAHIQLRNKRTSINQVITIAIGFLNNTSSKVICQGDPSYQCGSCYQGKITPVFLHAAFFDPGENELEVNNTFIADGTKGFLHIHYSHNSLLDNLDYSTHSLAKMNKVLLCTVTNHLDHPVVFAEYAEGGANNSNMNLVMTDIAIFDCYSHTRHDNSGLMKFEGVNVLFNGTNTFKYSGDGSAIRAARSTVTLTGTLKIDDDYYESNGIGLESDSTLQLKEPLNATFNNQGGSRGSAIYASDSSSINILSDKTFSLENLTSIEITLTFTNSSSSGANTQVYAPEFNFLHVDNSEPAIFKEWDDNHNQYAYTTVIDTIFKNISDYDKFTSLSNGLCLQIQGQHKWTCKYLDSCIYNYTECEFDDIDVYPGGIAFSFTDYKDLHVNNNTGINPHPRIENSNVYSCRIDGSLNLQVTPIGVNITMTGVNTFLLMHMNFYPHCPTGFEIAYGEPCNKCICKKVLMDNQYQCDISTNQFTAPHGYWTGISEDQNGTIKISSNCPPHYCKANMSSFSLDKTLNDMSCLDNRSEVLCGQCRENYSAVFGSDVCYSHCNNLYLLTLPVYALAGLFLVVILFALRLTVATGTINGVIFYANILKLAMNVEVQESHEKFVQFMNIIISLLNLNLGFPLCLYKGMSTTAAIGFQFVFPVYLWSLVLGMVILSKYSSRVANLVSKSSVQVLATLFYLSFSSLLRTVIVVVSPTTLQLSNEEYDDSVSILVWYYGGLDYGSGVHGLYLTIAFLFVLFFLFPFAIFTTFSHCLLRFKLVNKLRPFIEAYGGPFKDKRRFWFGVRLWVTILLFLVDSVFQGSNTHTMLIAHFTIIAVFIVLQVGLRPFKKFWFTGFLDTIYMINLFFVYEFCLMINKEKEVYEVLLGVGLVSLVISLVYHFWLVRYSISFKQKSYKAINENEAENSDDSLFDAAKRREPAIELHGPRQTY